MRSLMRAVLQRVRRAAITADGAPRGKTGSGILAFLGFAFDDTFADVELVCRKILSIRIFEDDRGRMNRNLGEINGDLAIVSQFTLFGNMKKGSRPSFNRAANPDTAIPLYERTVQILSEQCCGRCVTGVFGADMQIDALNDGPVTIVLDSRQRDF